MKNKQTFSERVIVNIIKIRNEKKLTQIDVASSLDIDMSTYSKIESGKIALSVERLAKIASFFKMEVVDVIYYPIKYVKYDSLSQNEKNILKPKITVQIELNEDKKEKILEMLFEGREIEF